jgi:hypothetical protein
MFTHGDKEQKERWELEISITKSGLFSFKRKTSSKYLQEVIIQALSANQTLSLCVETTQKTSWDRFKTLKKTRFQS